MIIVQLSDLHVGSQFQPEVFETIVKEVNELNPDVIVITGDLTNEGLMKEYKKCKSLLTQFNTKKLFQLVEIMIIETLVIYYSKNSFHLKQSMS